MKSEKPLTYQEELKQKSKKNFNHMSFDDLSSEDESTKLTRLLFLQRRQVNLIERILKNVLFFFWVFIISFIIYFFSIALAGL